MARKRKSLDSAGAPPVDRWKTVLIVGFVALVVARTFVPEDPGGKLGLGAPLNVLWIVLAGAWLLRQLRQDELPLRFGAPDALMLALLGWYTVSAVVAIWIGSPRPAMNALWDWVAMGVLLLIARQLLETEHEVRATIVVMLGLACGMSAVAVHQYYVTLPADIAVYEAAKHSTEELYEQTGQWLPPDSSERMRFETRLNSRLPAASFALSNSLAGFLVPWFVVLAGITRELRSRRVVFVSIALATLIVACVWFTGSRSAGVAMIAGLVFLAVERRPGCRPSWANWRAALAGCVAIAGATIILAGTSFGKAALFAAWRSVAFRIEYWRATLTMIADYPFFGCGPGQFQDTYTAYKLVGAAEEIQDPHNWLLEVWATAGTPAVIIFLMLLGAVILKTLLRGSGATQDSDASHDAAPPAVPDGALFGGVAGVVLGIALAFLAGFPIAGMHVLLFVVSIVGTWFVFVRWTREGRLPTRLPLIAAAALLVNLLAAGGIGYPGVADSLWLLLAMQLNVLGAPESDIRNVPASTSVRWCAGAALATVLAIAIRFEYLPVMGSRLQLDAADDARAAGAAGPNRAALEAALAADPWSAAAAARLASQQFADYQSLPTASQIKSFAEADAVARRLAPRNAGVWAQSADYSAAIYRDTQRVEYRKAAEEYYAQALALYPTNARLQAAAARFWQSVGDAESARDAAAEALRLDDATRAANHLDRFLDDALRKELESLADTPR